MLNISTGDMIFVFGSNVGGIHGAGAAKVAYEKHGAVWGQGRGKFGQSYAIPTRAIIYALHNRVKFNTLLFDQLRANVNAFIQYAKDYPELKFQVTQIGCGYAGYKPEQIAPLFKDAPSNCYFDTAWASYLNLPPERYWGSYE